MGAKIDATQGKMGDGQDEMKAQLGSLASIIDATPRRDEIQSK
jgi:hypothetical protein